MAGKGLHIVKRKRKDGTVVSCGLRWSRGYEPYVYLGTFANEKRAEKAKQRALDVLDLGGIPTPAMFNGGLTVAAPERVTLRGVADKWLAAKKHNFTSSDSRRVKENQINRVVRYFGDERNPSTITLDEVHSFYETLMAEKLAADYIGKLTQTGRAILRFAQVPNNPFNDERLEQPKGKRKIGKPLLTIAQLKKVWAELGVVERQLFDLMLHGGLRPSEACWLTWEQVRVDRLTKIYFKTWPRDVTVLPFQAAAGIDFIPVRNGEPDGFVFGTHPTKVKDGKPAPLIDAELFNDRMKDAGMAAGIYKPEILSVFPYNLRHLHVSRLHQWAGKCHDLSARQQADRLGHDLSTAESAYIQALPDEDAEAWDSAI